MPNRISGLTVSVFTLGTALIDDLEEATLTVENATEEGRGINDVSHFPVPLSGSWQIEGTLFCSSTAAPPLMATAIGTAPTVAVTFTVNPSTATTNLSKFTGTGVIKTNAHRTPNRALQKVNVTIVGQGALTIGSP